MYSTAHLNCHWMEFVHLVVYTLPQFVTITENFTLSILWWMALIKKVILLSQPMIPNGPWSEPYWLEDAPGIDPSLLFDDDGRAWYCGNRIPSTGEEYIGSS